MCALDQKARLTRFDNNQTLLSLRNGTAELISGEYVDEIVLSVCCVMYEIVLSVCCVMYEIVLSVCCVRHERYWLTLMEKL